MKGRKICKTTIKTTGKAFGMGIGRLSAALLCLCLLLSSSLPVSAADFSAYSGYQYFDRYWKAGASSGLMNSYGPKGSIDYVSTIPNDDLVNGNIDIQPLDGSQNPIRVYDNNLFSVYLHFSMSYSAEEYPWLDFRPLAYNQCSAPVSFDTVAQYDTNDWRHMIVRFDFHPNTSGCGYTATDTFMSRFYIHVHSGAKVNNSDPQRFEIRYLGLYRYNVIDWSSIKNNISAINSDTTTIKNDLSTVKSTLSAVSTKINTIETNIGNINTKINNISTKVNNISTKVNNIDTNVDNIDENVYSILKEIQDNNKKQEEKDAQDREDAQQAVNNSQSTASDSSSDISGASQSLLDAMAMTVNLIKDTPASNCQIPINDLGPNGVLDMGNIDLCDIPNDFKQVINRVFGLVMIVASLLLSVNIFNSAMDLFAQALGYSYKEPEVTK